MASEKELLEALAVQEMPIAASDLARQVNSTVEAVSTQLKRVLASASLHSVTFS